MTRVMFCHPRPCAANPATRMAQMPCFVCPASVAAPADNG